MGCGHLLIQSVLNSYILLSLLPEEEHKIYTALNLKNAFFSIPLSTLAVEGLDSVYCGWYHYWTGGSWFSKKSDWIIYKEQANKHHSFLI